MRVSFLVTPSLKLREISVNFIVKLGNLLSFSESDVLVGTDVYDHPLYWLLPLPFKEQLPLPKVLPLIFIPDKESESNSRSRIPLRGTFSLGTSDSFILSNSYGRLFNLLWTSFTIWKWKEYDQGQHPIPSTIGRLELAWREVPSRIFKDEKDRKPVDSDAWWEKWVGILPCPPESNPVGGQPHGIGYLPSLVLPILDLY